MDTPLANKGFHLDLSVHWTHTRRYFGLPAAFLRRAAVAQTLHRTLLLARQCQHQVSDTLPLQLGWESAQIGVRVVDAQEGRTLNNQYRGKDYATNVLTFDYAHSPTLCADIVLCAPVLASETAARPQYLQAHYRHMLVHGTLHALGLDHERSRSQAQSMQALEVLILHALGIPNPYKR